MQWCLDLFPQNLHLKCYGFSNHFTMEHARRVKRGGIIGIRNNLLNKEWVEMCGVAYNPSAVTNEPKIHGVTAAGEAPQIGGRGG